MSCCTCGSGCQSGCGCRIIVLPDNPVEGYTMVNINTLGIGVYDSTEGTTFQMRGIYSASPVILITLDAANAAIKVDIDADQLILEVPQATTTQKGIGETATDAEAIAKASVTTFLTPSNLAALGSSTTFAGLVELATNAETQTGTSTTLAVTPAGLASVIDLQQGTVTFADAVARAAAVPDFNGQLGSQLDTNIAYVATGTNAGEWSPMLVWGQANVMSDTTTISTNGSTLTFISSSFIGFDSTTTFTSEGINNFGSSGTTATFNFEDVSLQIAGVTVPAASLLVTAGAGIPSSRLLNTILSTANVQTGWAVTNPSVTRTLDVAAADLATTRAVLGTLINDLKAILLPAT